MCVVAWPLENGEPKPDWKPGTDTIADIRPGSFLQRSYEERQRKPDDLEAQEGQRAIAIHALENLAHSNTGIVMLRRLFAGAAEPHRARPRPDQHHAGSDGEQADSDRRLEHDPVAGRSCRAAIHRGPLTKRATDARL
jgi:hypothetical protein